MGSEYHRPVMPREVLRMLAPRSGGVYLDATVGGGGHARLILEASAPDGFLVGMDRTPKLLQRLRKYWRRLEGVSVLCRVPFPKWRMPCGKPEKRPVTAS